MKHSQLLITVTIYLLGMLPGWSQVPQLLNFQGRISVDGTNFGSPTPQIGHFRFALVDQAGTTTHWSNDKTSAAGSEPTAAVDLTVTNGHYSVLLGDATLTNMTILPATVFTNPEVYLRTWFDDGGGSELLVPDRRIAAVGYAMLAASVEDGAITTAKLAGGSVTGPKLAANAVNSGHISNGSISANDLGVNSVLDFHIVSGGVGASEIASNAVGAAEIGPSAVGSSELAANSVRTGKILDGTILDADLANNTITGAKLADILDLGSTSANGILNVWANASDLQTIRLTGSASQISTFGSDGLEQARLWGGSYGELLLRDDQVANNIAAAIGASQLLSAGGYMELRNQGDLRAQLKANTTTGGTMNLYQADGGLGVNFNSFTNSAGRGTIYDANATPSILFNGSSNAITLYQADDASGVILDGESGGGGAAWLYQADGDIGIFLDGENAGASWLSMRHSDGNARVSLDGQSTGSGGEITVRDGSGTETVEILGAEGTNLGGRIRIFDEAGNIAAALRDDKAEGGGELWLYNASGIGTVAIEAQESATDGSQINLYDNTGTRTMTLDAEFGVGGSSRVTTGTVEITGGADLSEQFEISTCEREPEPGMLVCIDPENPGYLKPSTKAYDRTVAGIISGAGGVRTGLLMGQRDSLADGAYPIALTGRVYCKMDAAGGPIEPGDLITTSDTPGHGMKASDYDKARGAIIGKAMTRLEEGTGLVLVLVSLQ